MKRKHVLLTAVIALLIFVMPSTVSLFTGQHTWYAENDIRCEKCHTAIYDELTSELNKAHTGDWAKKCQGCHATSGIESTGLFFETTGKGTNRTKQGFHAATTIECITCHSGVAVSAYNPANYNSTTGTWKDYKNSLGSPNEAHRAFAMNVTSTVPMYNNDGTLKSADGNQSDILLKGANTACVGCHTHTVVTLNWDRPTGYNITVGYNEDGTYNLKFAVNKTGISG